jgi:hypothetical protein
MVAAARSRGLEVLLESFLGLTPQALCCRLLRRLVAFISANFSRTLVTLGQGV